MRSMFSNASFSRFDLGRHILGQANCPTGQMPMNQNGRIVCVPFSPPSGMFMPMGPSTSVAYGMGQAGMQDPYLTQAERDQLLLDIQTAVSKTGTIDKLNAWGAANDPGLKKYLARDASRYNTLMNSIASLFPTVRDLGERLADMDGESWWRPSTEEMAQVKQWVVGVTEMFKIIQNHKANPYAAPPGTQPPPSLEIAAPEPTGISTQNLLVGGAVAAGIALLVAVLS